MKIKILVLFVFFIACSIFSLAGTPAPSNANATEIGQITSGNAYLSGVLIILLSVVMGYVSRKLFNYRRLAIQEV